MTFKLWLQNELVSVYGVEKERPELLATALPGIYNKADEPPKSKKKTPTARYDVKKALSFKEWLTKKAKATD